MSLYRAFLACALATCLSGCNASNGETFSITAAYAGKYDHYNKIVYSPDGYVWSYVDGSAIKEMYKSAPPLISISGAMQYDSHDKKKIPNQVNVIWQTRPENQTPSQLSKEDQVKQSLLPKTGGPVAVFESDRYTNPHPNAKIFGPYLIDVRSRIPQRVLSLVSSKDYHLEITIEVTENYQKTYWALFDRRPYSTTKHDGIGKPVVCAGGDGIDNISSGVVGLSEGRKVRVWPKCDLPK